MTGRHSVLAALFCVVLLLVAMPGSGRLSAAQPGGWGVLTQDAWIEDGLQATVEDVSTRWADRFAPSAANAIYPLGPGKTLWLRLRVQNQVSMPSGWGLDIPVPLLDVVTLFQRERAPDGRWQAQRAGDLLPVATWSRPGRYPGFDLAVPTGPPREVFVQVRHRDPIGFALRIGPAAALEQTRQVEYLVLGMVLGTLLLLTVSCLIQSALHRDITYAWYALYAAGMTLTMATVTGVSGHLLWNRSPGWTDSAQGLLPVLLAGVNILFLRHLCSIAARYPRTDRLALATGVLVLLLGLVFQGVNGWVENAIVAFSFIVSLALTFTLGLLAWRRHDVVGGWVILAYVPLALTVGVAMLRLYGWVTATWLTFDGTAAASAMAVPLLLLALNARVRDRHGARTRVNQLTQQDALTGLLSPLAFERQLKAAVSGALMRHEAAAVVLVDVVNLPAIRRIHGDAMAEQCLLRAVIKLQRVVRDGDPAGRIDTGRFGLIFEGVKARAELQERLVRLVASGLVPPRGARMAVPLQFHVACVLLGEKLMAPSLVLRDLDRLLASMSPRTRRPIRFVEPDDNPSGAPTGGPPSSALPDDT